MHVCLVLARGIYEGSTNSSHHNKTGLPYCECMSSLVVSNRLREYYLVLPETTIYKNTTGHGVIETLHTISEFVSSTSVIYVFGYMDRPYDGDVLV